MDKFVIRRYFKNYSNYRNNYAYKTIKEMEQEESAEVKEMTKKLIECEVCSNTCVKIMELNNSMSLNDNNITSIPIEPKLIFNDKKYLPFLKDIIALSSTKYENVIYKKIIKSKIIDPFIKMEELIPCLKIIMSNPVQKNII